ETRTVLPTGWLPETTSAGQLPFVPEQNSAGSQAAVEARHSTVLGWKASKHELLSPAQWSSPSHGPPFEAPMHAVVEGAKASAGHAALPPRRDSAASQTPAGARQTVDEGRKESDGQAALSPVQLSATSQSPAGARQTVVAGSRRSGGHEALPPVH